MGVCINETTDSYPHLVQSLGDALAVYHRGTFDHSARVGRRAIDIGDAVGLDQPTLQVLGWAGMLHDLGKLAVPQRILGKTGPLTPAEWERVRLHPATGYDLLLATSPQLTPVAVAVRAHHERWDGTGYPDGLAGEEIPLLGRIIAVADVYDALTHNRSYRRGHYSDDQARTMIMEHGGSHFDPRIAAVFLDLLASEVSDDGAAADGGRGATV